MTKINQAKAVQRAAARRLRDAEKLKRAAELDCRVACGALNSACAKAALEIERLAAFLSSVAPGDVEYAQRVLSAELELDGRPPSVLNDLSISALDIVGVGSATGVSAIAGFGASAAITAAVATYGTASTGVAIAGLTGIAAEGATLATIGGGALSAGGLGIAGGTAVLGGVVVAPVVIGALIAVHLVGAKKLSQARENSLRIAGDVVKIEAETARIEGICESAQGRILMITRLRALLAPRLSAAIASVGEQAHRTGSNAALLDDLKALLRLGRVLEMAISQPLPGLSMQTRPALEGPASA